MADEDIIRKLNSGNLIEVTQIIWRGDVNRVYLVRSGNSQRIVRLNDESEIVRFKKEAWCLEEAKKRGIPSPELIKMGVMDSCAYMVLSFIQGLNSEDIKENRESVWRTIGKYAKVFHNVETIGFGENMISAGNFSDTWDRYLNYNIESLNPDDKLIQMGTLTFEQSGNIKSRFVQLKERKFNFSLVHGDLSLANVIVNDDKVTLIDWGVAEVNVVPHLEIIGVLQNQLQEKDSLFSSFLDGYGMSRDEYILIKPEIQILSLLQAIDKLRWAIDKNQEKMEEFSTRVRSIVADMGM